MRMLEECRCAYREQLPAATGFGLAVLKHLRNRRVVDWDVNVDTLLANELQPHPVLGDADVLALKRGRTVGLHRRASITLTARPNARAHDKRQAVSHCDLLRVA